MSEDLKRTGECLCGAVKYEVTLTEPHVHVCHCDLCRGWGGGPNLSAACEKDWVIEGEENLTWYDSSEWAQLGFCNKCGTHLFGRVPDGDYRGIHVGNLHDSGGLEIGMHIFIDKKPSFYDFTDSAKRITGAEFYAMVSGEPADE